MRSQPPQEMNNDVRMLILLKSLMKAAIVCFMIWQGNANSTEDIKQFLISTEIYLHLPEESIC